jgi:hypothetical protein
MMIVSRTAQRTSLFHAERAYAASSQTVKSFETQKARKKMQTAATSVTAGLLFPQNAVNMDWLSNYARTNRSFTPKVNC